MKLTVERITKISAQDRHDLSFIWPHQDFDILEKDLNDDHRLFAARFNGHLLAGVIVEIDSNSSCAELTDMQVRTSTRRHGVGKYLIEEVLRACPDVKEWWLDAADHALVSEDVMDKFMHSCGFYAVSGGWEYIVKTPQPDDGA
ncbi:MULTISPECIES: aspartate 1-decarboxylase autocleavage activator PanM [Musicola]|uniref:PanD regulatory factor n=1 Tax=Musicola paradisiaca (strain Ech703) TaxID=579405 RepID=C6C5I9_MUSP7|nr:MULTISPECIES: aspartate 1-decarboxylase autocleavage activator PanM [Musicola]ACS87626.1 GCN5-related N-acetyltransferase [Musicola paradisiaca Ech703]